MSDGQRLTPEQIMEQFERMRSEAEATLARYEEVSAEFGADAVEVASDDGLLHVKLDANGKVDEITVNEAAMRYRQSLGPNLVALIRQARDEYALKSAEMARRLLGDRMDVDAILGRYLPPKRPDAR
ncbi:MULTISPECIES: YbaB/EbfC family nucleoid-associated protein [Glycomyces]|uniref:YbaB/EbfC DNA-binding family protein n=1 Tax=Glycomyces artemisiae TaxID=1076443 RepID=A0A2T0UTJ7_9ACTN|nr:YbaB/EbfC family nucleoid-associated protein [Glycomyces artemisiae]PRY61252.1 YbaB/EbfC DNA-binding family protein [Glycomyces artemisiae]